MFDDKEEVKKAMMDLKLFGLGDFESPDEDILESTIEGAENQIQVKKEETILTKSVYFCKDNYHLCYHLLSFV